MVSKNQIKLITSLHQKKFRLQHGLFLAEGIKVIQELLESNIELHHLYQTEPLFDSVSSSQKTLISQEELAKMTALTTPNNCLAVFKIPELTEITQKGLIIVLDDIRDPGNLGTILRLCDWFGIEQVVCSKETVDLYNPKVIQATMGSISRVKVSYVDLLEWIQKTNLPVYGTFMTGTNIYKEKLPKEGIIVLGNEANGISKEIEKCIQNRITIPRFGKLKKTESLNVASATAILLSEFCRSEC
jgi:RNA methyltransferase, TrmH family